MGDGTPSIEPVLAGVGRWVSTQTGASLDRTVSHAGTRAIVDWFSATLPGATMPPARLLDSAQADAGVDDGDAILVTTGRRVGARTAALVNGTASHTAELDDIYREGIYHPGSPTVAAALAVGQHRAGTGTDLLCAVVAGFEVSTRVAAAMQPSHYRYWHTTGTVGTLGAAVAAASLLRLDGDGVAHAVATAATMAAGLQQAFRSDAMSKPLHAGHAADAGVMAAFAAARGFTGARDILEGDAGFGAAMSDAADLRTAFDDLGETFNIERMTVKNHANCGHTFAAIDAALELRVAHGIDPEDVDRIEVATYRTAVEVAGHPDPTTAFEARFSVAYAVAAALVRGSVRLAAFDPEALADERIRRLVATTDLRVDDELDAAFPGQRGARTVIHLRDGSRVEAVRSTRKGDPDDPLTDEELRAKYDELARPRLGLEQADRLAAQLWDLQGVDDLRTLAFAPD